MKTGLYVVASQRSNALWYVPAVIHFPFFNMAEQTTFNAFNFVISSTCHLLRKPLLLLLSINEVCRHQHVPGIIVDTIQQSDSGSPEVVRTFSASYTSPGIDLCVEKAHVPSPRILALVHAGPFPLEMHRVFHENHI